MRLTVEMHFALKYLPYVYAYYFAFFLKKVRILAETFNKFLLGFFFMFYMKIVLLLKKPNKTTLRHRMFFHLKSLCET